MFDDGGEGLAGVPLGWGDGLAVVVGVEDDGAFGAGRLDLAPDYGWDSQWKVGRGEKFCFGPAQLQLGEEILGVSSEAGGVNRNVWDGEEELELFGKICLARGGVVAGCLWRSLGGEWGHDDGEQQGKVPREGHGETLACVRLGRWRISGPTKRRPGAKAPLTVGFFSGA